MGTTGRRRRTEVAVRATGAGRRSNREEKGRIRAGATRRVGARGESDAEVARRNRNREAFAGTKRGSWNGSVRR